MTDNIVPFIKPKAEDSPPFAKHLQAAIQHMGEFALALHERAVNCAMAGPWAEWDAEQPAGTGVQITGASLAQTGDARITALYGLYQHTCDVLSQLRAASGGGGRHGGPSQS